MVQMIMLRVTAVMELARMFSQNKTQEKVNYVFALSLPKKMVLLVLKTSRRCKIEISKCCSYD